MTSDLSERSKQLQSAQTEAHQAFQQSKAQHADLLSQLKTAQLATQQAHDAQVEAEQQLQSTQQASVRQLSQDTADVDHQVHAAKHSAREESAEKQQILQHEYENQLAAAMSEADQKMSALTTQLSQQLQAAQGGAQQQQLQVNDMQHQADTQLQTHQLHQQLEVEHQERLRCLEQQLQAQHDDDSLKQLQQQLQACQQECESLQAEKLALEQQVQSAKADSARDLQELRDKTKSTVAAQMRQHSCKLEDEQSAHKKAAGRHQIEMAELQAALERQQEDSVRREHQVLQEHMAGPAAKDTMVQQMWSELHESKQGSRRYAFNCCSHPRTSLTTTSTFQDHPLSLPKRSAIVTMQRLDIKSQLLHVCCNQDTDMATSCHSRTTGLYGQALALHPWLPSSGWLQSSQLRPWQSTGQTGN